MNIQRNKLKAAFSQFAKRLGGIVIGAPGVGKTFLLKAFSDENQEQKEILTLYLPIDKLGVENETDLKAFLGINKDFIDFIKEQADENQKQGVLVIDAFDAARSETAKRFFLNLIKRVLKNLKDTWNVVVSVRTYDAMKSLELQDLFPPQFDSKIPSEYQMSRVYCRHFFIHPLADEERDEAIGSIPNLPRLCEISSKDFRELLRIPFNLWLVEKILTTQPETKELSQVNSVIQLLGLFWRYRITSDDLAEERQVLLSKVTRAMVNARSLSVRTDQVYSTDIRETWKSLLNSEVLVYPRQNEQRVTYQHNILFDYAVSILLIEDDLNEFVSFLNEDISRPLFLRPSLNFYFTRLWHESPNVFWKIFWSMLPNANLHVRLFARLLPPSVIINEARNFKELQPLIDAIQNDEKIAKDAVLRVLQAYRMFDSEHISTWTTFLAAISKHISNEFAWDLAFSINKILEAPKTAEYEPLQQACGFAARKLLSWVWQQRAEQKANPFIDNIGAVWAVPMVARSFGTDVTTSKQLLISVLRLLNEPDFPITYFYRLAEEVNEIWIYDPEFVQSIYLNIFAHSELSEEKTQFGTAVVPMTSTRRQDFNMCHHVLIQKYPEFIKSNPLVAARTAILSLNKYIIDKRDLDWLEIVGGKEESGSNLQEFSFRGSKAHYLIDQSGIWDSSYRDEPFQIADSLFYFIENLASSGDNTNVLDPILDEFRDSALAAFFWKRLLETGSRIPNFFAPLLFELCLAPPILLGSDTSSEVGKFIEVAIPYFTNEQRVQIERTIIEIFEREVDNSKSLQYWRNRLISRIPSEFLETIEGKRIRREMEEAGNIPLGERSRGFHFESRVLTEDVWLQDEGVDVEKLENKELLSVTARLGSFESNLEKSTPTPEIIKSMFDQAKSAFSIFERVKDVDKQVYELAWTRLASFATALSRRVTNPDSEEFRFCREILLRGAKFSLPEPNPDNDAKYSSPGWSPTPRTEAAQGLPWLARLDPEQELMKTIIDLVNDPVPSIRFLVTSELIRFFESAPDIFWEVVQQIAENEENKVVQEALFRILSFVAVTDEANTTIVLEIFFNSNGANLSKVQAWGAILPTVVGLALARQNKWAINILELFLNDPVGNSEQVRVSVFNALTFINPKRLSDPKNELVIDRAVNWLLHAIESVSESINDLLEVPSEIREEAFYKKLHRTYGVIDEVVSRIYFAAKIKDDIGLDRESEKVTEEERQRYYFKIKPLLEQVLRFARGAKNGFLFAPTAYHFTQLLNGVLRYDPRNVLEMAAGVASAGEPTGFTLDAMAETQVTRLVEVILADYKYEVREGDSLEHLLSLLDIFAKNGSSEALRLVWRLDEVYR